MQRALFEAQPRDDRPGPASAPADPAAADRHRAFRRAHRAHATADVQDVAYPRPHGRGSPVARGLAGRRP